MVAVSEADRKISDIVEQTRVRGSPVGILQREFESEDELVDYLESGKSLSDIDGVGRKTASSLMHWFKDEHPDAYRRMHDNDESVFTEFEEDVDDEIDDSSPVWGAYCPQPDCGDLNKFAGDPSEFAGRPVACCHCGWVSLMDKRVRDLEVSA